MAKKYEFQPDRPRSSWLSKLYLTKLQRQALLKWCLYGLVLLVLSLLQDVVLCRFRLFGTTSDLIPCSIILICILEGTQRGSVFALIAALLYHFSGAAPGAHTIVLITFLAIGTCALRQGYLQKSFSSAMVCLVLGTALYELLIFAAALFFGSAPLHRMFSVLITTCLSLLSAPILYPVYTAIGSIGGDAWKE